MAQTVFQRRALLRAVVGGVGVALLAACAPPAPAPSATPVAGQPAAITPTQAPATQPARKLTFWMIQPAPSVLDAIKAIINDYQAAKPSTTVNLEIRGTDPHKEALRVSLGTPAAPDVFYMYWGPGQGGFYVDAGTAEPLDAYYTQYKWTDRFLPAALAYGKFGSSYYGMPFQQQAMGLWYRKDLFQKVGASEPASYADLMATNARLKDGGITPLSIGGKFGWNTMRLFDALLEMSAGTTLHDNMKALKEPWTRPETTTAYQELATWSSSDYLPKGFLGVDPTQAKIPVYKGQAAMLYDTTSLGQNLIADQQDSANYDFFPFPTATNRLAAYTPILMMAKNSMNKEAAGQFLDFISSPDIQTRYRGQLSPVSPVRGISPDPSRVHDVKWAQFLEKFPNTWPPSDQALPSQLVSAYFATEDGVCDQSIAAAEAGARFQAEVDKFRKA